MPSQEDFNAVFARLKAILQSYESNLVVQADAPGNYTLNTHYVDKYKKPIFFGAVQIRKNYVSYHLMLVYIFPDLLTDISPRLKKRMQGKSCFNFASVDDELFAELARLTQAGVERSRTERLV